MDKFECIVKNLSKTNKKNYENYVLNAIYSRIGNLNLIPIAQQCVLSGGKHYLIDLYFPQINLAVEVDESHHKNRTNQDKLRTEDILSAVKTLKEEDIFRVDVYSKSIEEVDRKINDIVNEVKSRIAKIKNLYWETEEDKIQRIISERTLIENETFDKTKVVDILKIFNITHLKSFSRCYRKIDDEVSFWSPTLTVYSGGKKIFSDKRWKNVLSENWEEITEEDEKNDLKTSSDAINKEKRIVFVKAKDSLGNIGRRFVGVFLLYKVDKKGVRYYKKIAGIVDLSKYFQ